jgi:hypothetical protein
LWAAARAQWHCQKAIQLAFALEEDILRKPAVILANTAATGATHTEVEADPDPEVEPELGADPELGAEAVRKAPRLELAFPVGLPEGLPEAPDNTAQEEQGLAGERLPLRRDCCSQCVPQWTVTRQMPHPDEAAVR